MNQHKVSAGMGLATDEPEDLLPVQEREGRDVFDDELVTVREITTALNIGPTKWWEGVKKGIYPKPIYLGARCTRWSKRAIAALMRTGVQQPSV